MRTIRNPGAGHVGFDLSLRAPAAVFIPWDWKLGEWRSLAWETIRPEEVESGDVRGGIVRTIKIAGWARDFVLSHRANFVSIEAYAFSKQSRSVTALAELGGVARVELLTHGRCPRILNASEARGVLLGKVRKVDMPDGIKVYVQAALHRAGAPIDPGQVMRKKRTAAMPKPGVWSEDIADAFVIANAARTYQRLPAVVLA